ncbi:sugar phosphate isomerase/epimerase [Paenibacillus endophyticus]|uniref:Sugar phosphate isomerase/epimerase n=1 Tax=Paenibacillus endophyticus TaxID=1294268 RepID=A0A7W5CCP3_9BACL|nr:sugar phosphate isomerase/epimerase family protein [Paenibacillus endophyticus]MBB3155282.1 sugar phosphate isomerase/epimerase [Paenibacillus endophyticus]
MNRIGWCMGIEQAALLASKGFDYIECPLTSLPLEDELALAKRLPLFLDSPLQVGAMNLFLPQSMLAVGPEVDRERLRRYVSKAGETISAIGAQIVVLGSGRQRMIPEGWSKQQAEEQLLELLQWISEEWTGNGAVLALEPLNRKESNLINRVEEAVQLVRQLNHANIRVLADFYHMDEEDEPLDTLLAHKEWIAHIHVADTGRLAPGTGSYPYERFSQLLREMNYTGMISAECTLKEGDTELADSLAFMKRMAVNGA